MAMTPQERRAFGDDPDNGIPMKSEVESKTTTREALVALLTLVLVIAAMAPVVKVIWMLYGWALS